MGPTGFPETCSVHAPPASGVPPNPEVKAIAGAFPQRFNTPLTPASGKLVEKATINKAVSLAQALPATYM